MVLFTLKPNLVLADCWSVDVIKGAFGLTFTGFLEISFIDKLHDSICCFIVSTFSFESNGSVFLVARLNLIVSSLLVVAENEISQYSSGINSWIDLSLSSKSLKATD